MTPLEFARDYLHQPLQPWQARLLHHLEGQRPAAAADPEDDEWMP